MPNIFGGKSSGSPSKSFLESVRTTPAPDLAHPDSPKTGSLTSFVQTYLPVAEKVGQRIGVAPKNLLAQWGVETGWGKSVVPGTNNLGNIKDFSGAGAKAVDNYTKTTDAYRSYKTADDFGNDFAGVIERVHKGAMNTGDDAGKYFGSLKRSGYAEHPEYVNMGVKASRMVDKELQRMRPMKTSDASDAQDEYNPTPLASAAGGEYEQAWNQPEDETMKASA
ncbi:glucosaminidase domain-containing protein [Polynucleobacter sp. UK-Kesae-W10]|uniref:glucosaminidase domain-containing protein n=1 Tax=Polynucleobacter sp. UK-Kesae-W10 TaxID=1819738 RepID=UPI001C0E6B37|nr:glucosaminidase domain-containing protein [Polynucleobacter sp. UK-Kesae-W10]MBU3577605.1 glucosaminidase domain-containing protein [Polynucleobacter sp. UK-Kesae-W10]